MDPRGVFGRPAWPPRGGAAWGAAVRAGAGAAFVFVALAVANEFIWRTMSTDTWVKLETFAMPAALVLFLWVQIFALQSYLIDPAADPDAAAKAKDAPGDDAKG